MGRFAESKIGKAILAGITAASLYTIPANADENSVEYDQQIE